MPKNEILTIGAIASNIVDIIEAEMGHIPFTKIYNLEEKIIKEMKPFIKPTNYGYETDEIVE